MYAKFYLKCNLCYFCKFYIFPWYVIIITNVLVNISYNRIFLQRNIEITINA